MSDTQYQTYYNYATGDLYNSVTGENYNYNTNLYTYYSTTTTSSVTYSKYYQPPVYSKIYIPPVYAKVDVSKNQAKKKKDNKVVTGFSTAYTKPAYVAPPPKTYLADGLTCTSSFDCSNYCCAKNIVVMPMESIQDLYNLRPQFYDKDTNTYSPPGGKVYTYTDKSGGYDTEYGCYGGSYYNVAYMQKESVAYDAAKKGCLGGYMADLNYVNYNSSEWIADAKVKNLTAPVDMFWSYIPQKSNDTWNYAEKVCQSNKTMCATEGGGSGGIVGGVLGLCFVACVAFVIYKTCCAKAENKVEEVMVE